MNDFKFARVVCSNSFYYYSSISYKFNTRNKDTQVSNKREELLKRIEETRKKLQSVSKEICQSSEKMSVISLTLLHR